MGIEARLKRVHGGRTHHLGRETVPVIYDPDRKCRPPHSTDCYRLVDLVWMASCGGVGCEREESRRIHIDPAVEHLICVDHVSRLRL